ncbi:MAG: sugar phosphate nucleotidyltransferase [Nitrososphaeria archaeon]
MEIGKIRCFIPVGGQAKRLRPLTQDISKPCIRFLNRPLIEFSMATLAEQGIRHFIFGEYGYTNYSNLFDRYGEGLGFSTKYRIEPRVHIKHQPNLDDVGSADSYRLNAEYYDIKGPVLVVQGDSLFDIDLKSFVEKHEQKKAMMTIALAKVKNTEEFGIADVDGDGRIRRFVEKPPTGKAPSDLANAGVYLLSPEVRQIVSSDEMKQILVERQRLDFGYDLIPYIIERGYPVYSYELKAWYDIGTPERYLAAMRDVLYGALNIRVTEERIIPGKNVWVQGYSEESIRRRIEIVRKYQEKKLFLEGATLIGRHTRIGDFTKIVDSNVDNFCIIGENMEIVRSAVLDAVRIGDHAKISDSIIGRKVIIESNHKNPTSVESVSVIGNAVRIGAGCKLYRTKVNPHLVIPPNMTYVNKYLQTYEDIVNLTS